MSSQKTGAEISIDHSRHLERAEELVRRSKALVLKLEAIERERLILTDLKREYKRAMP